ncbi:MAG: helix-turn-helix domain-containing protein [Lachnospiraceae bacterium]|nr:helix-turn-helix domain-containing protein [Lachnospiraceae bacterium]
MTVKICLLEMGKRITERRKKLGLTQEALAELSDLTPQFVSYAESGKRAMRPENLMRIALALNVSTDYLLTGDIIDKDMLILSGKLQKLKPSQVRLIEYIIDECIDLYNDGSSSSSLTPCAIKDA